MQKVYAPNGLLFWTQEDIKWRNRAVEHITDALQACLLSMNSAFQFVQIEATLLTPDELINPGYSDADVFRVGDGLTLRPETTMGSYAAAQLLLDPYNQTKRRPPLVVWQHGKSFRREQDQVTKNMRLKEFYQLEFQILFSPNTAKDYAPEVIEAMRVTLSDLVGECRTEPSDRLPDYSEETTDVVHVDDAMEVCSISRRKDYPGLRVLEVAVGTDRLCYQHHRKLGQEF